MRRAMLKREIVRRGLGLGAGMLAVAVTGAHAQTAAEAQGPPGRTLSIVPRLSITETLTDNSRLVTADRQSDLITQIAPGLRITSSGGRVKGFLDYSLNGLIYARNSKS